jgi:CRISPR-associated endonuclease/helicase Cas3
MLIGPDTPLHRYLRAADPEEPSRPLILVATQCLEVGADFSFDALVTECASLDALRQRFGRLDRLGEFDKQRRSMNRPSEITAKVFVAASSLEESDPIYGPALKATWDFLSAPVPQEPAAVSPRKTGKEQRIVDFGVNALTPLLPAGDELLPFLAPAPDAPVLLPAHLDLLCQTAPRPHPEPDLAPFLHGKGRGQAEVRIVWRCDLDPEQPDDWPEIVSLSRPVAGEMLPVPLYRLQQWLRNRAPADPTGDVESAAGEADEARGAAFAARHFLLWRGRDQSSVRTNPDDITPGSVVVLPAPEDPAEAETLGQALRQQGFGRDQLDLWEVAWQQTGRPPTLRLHRACLAPWLSACPPLAALLDLAEGEDWTLGELRDALAAVRDWAPESGGSEPLPPWLRRLFTAVADVRKRDVAVHPSGGLVLRAPASLPHDEEPDLFADEDDQLSQASEKILLADHTVQVAQSAGLMARACLDDATASVIQAAARWHDAGKLDLRFQALLRGGLPDPDRPLAKSPDLPRAREQARRNREAAGLPDDFRHEMLSLQLAGRFAAGGFSPADHELFLHLIASHHGYARPFAPVCLDEHPPDVRGQLAGVAIALDAGQRRQLVPAHRLDSGLADRFWQLTRRFGWWGLAYREAILRLADWYASAHPQNPPINNPPT